MKQSKRIPKPEHETKLQRVVRYWLNNHGHNYGDGWRGAYSDLRHGGCQSGIVGQLIYYTDTTRFYRRYHAEIAGLLKEMMDGTGVGDLKELFGENWDAEDPLANEDLNQNLLAWFGFEETARNIALANGYED
jgi:hypothetical protein